MHAGIAVGAAVAAVAALSGGILMWLLLWRPLRRKRKQRKDAEQVGCRRKVVLCAAGTSLRGSCQPSMTVKKLLVQTQMQTVGLAACCSAYSDVQPGLISARLISHDWSNHLAKCKHTSIQQLTAHGTQASSQNETALMSDSDRSGSARASPGNSQPGSPLAVFLIQSAARSGHTESNR